MKVQTAFTVSFTIDGEMDEEEKKFKPQAASMDLTVLPEMNGLKNEKGTLTNAGATSALGFTADGLSVLFVWCDDKGYGKKDELLEHFISDLRRKTNLIIKDRTFKTQHDENMG